MDDLNAIFQAAKTGEELIEKLPESTIQEYINGNTKHISGSQALDFTIHECVVLCVVKNGEFHIEEFINYYLKLGVKHIVFLDNGSTDRTIDIGRYHKQVSFYQNLLPYKIYWHLFKRYLYQKFAGRHWNLIVDIDEFFDFPFSEVLKLRHLIDYLNNNNYTAVVAQMIDLFPNKNIFEINKSDSFLSSHKYFSTDNSVTKSYEEIIGDNNVINNIAIQFYLGGWRDSVFNVGEIMLTKHPLIKGNTNVKYTHDHFVYHANVANISCILKHYKFSDNFASYVEDACENEYHYNNSSEYKQYKNVLEKKDHQNFYSTTSKELKNSWQLVASRTIHISKEYLDKVQKIAGKNHLDVNTLCKIQSNILASEKKNKAYLQKHIRQLIDEKQQMQNTINEIKLSWSWKIGHGLINIIATVFPFMNKQKK